MRRWKRVVLGLAVLGVGLCAWSFLPSPLPAPARWTGPLPQASPPPEMAIYQLPTGSYRTKAAFAFRGGSFFSDRDFAATALLVRHPNGDLLFDAGFGENVDAEIRALPWGVRAPYTRGQSVRAQLAAAHYDLASLRGVVITHCHWDHVSGLHDLSVPVWINAAEERYSQLDRFETQLFRSFTGLKKQTYEFDGPPYLGFSASHDVYGDGSIVLVPSPGHTPGSIIAFITPPGGKRYALVGDLTWQLDGLTERAERPWMMRKAADSDPTAVRQDLLRMVALADHVQIIPAHDQRGFEGIPRLPAK